MQSSKFNYYLIVFLSGFITYEDFILKFLPGPDILYFASRFISELAVYLAFALLLFKKQVHKIPFRATPLDLPIGIFITVTVLSGIANQTPLFSSLLAYRPIFRYVPLFYVIVNTNITASQTKKIKLTIFVAGIIQLFLGFIQFFSPSQIKKFFLPRATDVEVAGESKRFTILEGGREEASINGAATDTIFFGMFMLILSLLVFNYIDNWMEKLSQIKLTPKSVEQIKIKKRIIIRIGVLTLLQLMITFAIALTYTRSLLITEFFIFLIWLSKYLDYKKVSFAVINFIFIFSVILTISPPQFPTSPEQETFFSNFTAIFTTEYVKQNIEKQRLGIIISVPPTVILNKPILGYGPDPETVVSALNESEPSFLISDVLLRSFKDTYWISILSRYGLAGLISMVWLFFRLYRSSQILFRISRNKELKGTSMTMKYLVIIFALQLFLDGHFEYRPSSFYFWLFAGLMFSVFCSQREAKRSKKLIIH